LHSQGVTTFVVASNDHRFAEIAAFAELQVLTSTEEDLGVRVRAAAEVVIVAMRDYEGWRWVRAASLPGDGDPTSGSARKTATAVPPENVS
jgi:hypothetical protein